MKRLLVGALVFIGLGTLTIAQAATDVGPYYWVFKRYDVRQTSTDAPATSGAPYHFFSLVERASGGQLTSDSNFSPPGGSLLGTQFYTVLAGGSLGYDTYFSSRASMDNALHAGKYALDLRSDTTTYLPKLTISADLFYPTTTPKLSNTNFKNGQLAVDATGQVTFNWNAFADHDSSGMDAIVLIITNTDGDVPVFRDVLPATATSKTFAANFFKKDQNYILDLSFVKVSQRNTTAISGSTGLAGYARSTRVYVSTSTHTPFNGLGNISTRGFVGTGDNVLISGFIVTSTDSTPLTVAIRAIGPSLSTQITDPLLDPTLELFDKDNHLIASSDNWNTTLPDANLLPTVLRPTDTRESALYRTLAPGLYTAVVRGKNNTTGVGLVEVYDIGGDGDAKLANISTRGQVLTDEKVMIGGFIIQGVFSHSVLVRALGPSIAGVSGLLEDPTLTVVNADGSTLASNNDWRRTQESQIEATQLQPPDDRESAVILSLGPGRYTAIVAGKNDKTGVALVEAYTLD